MCRYQNAGQNQNTKIFNKKPEKNVAKLKSLGTVETNANRILEMLITIQFRVFCHRVVWLETYGLKHTELKLFLVALYVRDTSPPILQEEHNQTENV
jgi:hypothetical protein